MPPAFVLSQDQTLNLTPPKPAHPRQPGFAQRIPSRRLQRTVRETRTPKTTQQTVQHQTKHLRPEQQPQPGHKPGPKQFHAVRVSLLSLTNQLCQIARNSGGPIICRRRRTVSECCGTAQRLRPSRGQGSLNDRPIARKRFPGNHPRLDDCIWVAQTRISRPPPQWLATRSLPGPNHRAQISPSSRNSARIAGGMSRTSPSKLSRSAGASSSSR